MHPFVWLNGNLLPAEEACISPMDAGFLLGDGLFETMRAYNGRALDLDRHLDRLARSAGVFRLNLPAAAALAGGVGGLIARNGCSSAVLRLTVTRGRRADGLGLLPGTEPTVFAYTTPLPSHATSGAPLRLTVPSFRIDATSPLVGHKTTSYLAYVWARQEAVDRGADEALLLNHARHVAECATANVFVVRDGRAATPPVADGCLPGIVRAVLGELGASLGVPVTEQHLTLDDLRRADEVFITNSLRELSPVASIDGKGVGRAPGEVTRRLLDAYRQRAAHLTGA